MKSALMCGEKDKNKKTIQHHKRGDEQTNYCNKNDHRLIIKKKRKRNNN